MLNVAKFFYLELCSIPMHAIHFPMPTPSVDKIPPHFPNFVLHGNIQHCTGSYKCNEMRNLSDRAFSNRIEFEYKSKMYKNSKHRTTKLYSIDSTSFLKFTQ